MLTYTKGENISPKKSLALMGDFMSPKKISDSLRCSAAISTFFISIGSGQESISKNAFLTKLRCLSLAENKASDPLAERSS